MVNERDDSYLLTPGRGEYFGDGHLQSWAKSCAAAGVKEILVNEKCAKDVFQCWSTGVGSLFWHVCINRGLHVAIEALQICLKQSG